MAGRGWLLATLVAGCLSAWPMLAYAYLPMVDLPMHQLEFAIWAEPKHWGGYYENAPWYFPYWFGYWLGRPWLAWLGVSVASKMALAMHVLLLPTAAGCLAKASGRSGWWGLLLAPFIYELNLSYGFVAYGLGWTLALFALASMLHLESSGRKSSGLFLALASLLVGWTHPQVAVMYVAIALGLQVLRRGASFGQRSSAAALSALALVPFVVWVAQPTQSKIAFGEDPVFAPISHLVQSLPRFSIDTLPGPTEELLFGAVIVLITAVAIRNHKDQEWSDYRLATVIVAALLGYFVLPWSWGGQAVGQRMPFVALLFLPMLLPTRFEPGKTLQVALIGVALVGIANTHLAIRGFHRETSAQVDGLLAATPEGAKVLFISYDNSSRWVHAPAYLHGGAWFALHAHGPYAFHFNRLVSHYTNDIPDDQTMIGKEFGYERTYQRKKRFADVDLTAMTFWDTVVVRWPPGLERPVMPFSKMDGARIESFDHNGQWGLVRLAR